MGDSGHKTAIRVAAIGALGVIIAAVITVVGSGNDGVTVNSTGDRQIISATGDISIGHYQQVAPHTGHIVLRPSLDLYPGADYVVKVTSSREEQVIARCDISFDAPYHELPYIDFSDDCRQLHVKMPYYEVQSAALNGELSYQIQASDGDGESLQRFVSSIYVTDDLYAKVEPNSMALSVTESQVLSYDFEITSRGNALPPFYRCEWEATKWDNLIKLSAQANGCKGAVEVVPTLADILASPPASVISEDYYKERQMEKLKETGRVELDLFPKIYDKLGVQIGLAQLKLRIERTSP